MGRVDTFADLGCLVTGASAGIGREIARLLADAGARIVITARREDRLIELCGELRNRGAREAWAAPIDLAAPDGVERVIASAEEALGHVDILVNNAGFAVPGPFVRSSEDRTADMIAVNVTAATQLFRRLLPGMLKRGRGGVLNVASVAAFQAAPYQAAYAGTKSYLLNLSESVYQEVKHTSVSVTALCPGVTDTEFFEAAGYRNLGPRSGFEVVAVTGPLMSPGKRARFKKNAAKIPGLTLLEYTDAMPDLIEETDFVVSMGGYNTVCELACAGAKALLVPRKHPRKEQWLRARLLAARGVVDYVDDELPQPDQLIDRVQTGLLAPRPPRGWNLDFRGLERSVRTVERSRSLPAMAIASIAGRAV